MWRYSGLLGGGGGGGSPVPTNPTYTSGRFGLDSAVPTGRTAGLANAVSASQSVAGGWWTLGTLTEAIDILDLWAAVGVGRTLLLDIRSGGPSGTQVVTSFPVNTVGTSGFMLVRLPIRLPAGQVEYRVSSSANSTPFNAVGFGHKADIAETAALIEPIGPASTSSVIDTGVEVLADATPVWVEITGGTATVNAYKRLIPFIAMDTDGTRTTSATYLVEIGVGPNSGALTTIGGFLVGSTTTALLHQGFIPDIKHAVAAGSKLWARITASTDPAGSDVCNVQLSGVR